MISISQKLASTAGSTRCVSILVLAAFTLGSAARGQELITDRPDFTESAIVVPKGSTQIESGATRTRAGDWEALSGPEVLVRLGLSERLELRIGLPDVIDVKDGPSGLGDGSLGFKWQIGPNAAGWDLGLIGTLSLPVGDDEFTSDAADPGLIFTLGRDLAGGWGLGTQFAVGQETEGNDERSVLAATVVLGSSVSRRVGLFVELAAEDVEGAETSVLAHHGYTFAANDRLQFDIHFGVGLTDGAPDSLLGAGVSWRR